jgi:undecaprenyl diphosphate synthase
MDGNRRFAKKHNISLKQSYKIGARVAYNLIKFSMENPKIRELTFYALSRENLKRDEVNIIFDLIREKNFKLPVKLRFIGDLKLIPEDIRKKLEKLESNRGKLKVNICFAYSGKWEIVEAVKKCETISEKEIEKNLLISPPEIIIRTGGYQRLSGFLLWQSSYSELYFTKKLWPEFKVRDLIKVLRWFKKVKRNFGL